MPTITGRDDGPRASDAPADRMTGSSGNALRCTDARVFGRASSISCIHEGSGGGFPRAGTAMTPTAATYRSRRDRGQRGVATAAAATAPRAVDRPMLSQKANQDSQKTWSFVSLDGAAHGGRRGRSIDELDVFTNFENFLPPDQAVRDTILLELQRTLSLRVQGPVSKEMRRKKKWGETAPQRLAHLHRKYF